MYLLKQLENQPKFTSILISMLMLVVISVIDYLVSTEISVSFLYLIPVGISTWCTDKYIGLFIILASDLINLILNQMKNKYHLNPYNHYWNAMTMLVFLLFTNFLLLEFKNNLKSLEELAQKDNLTGLNNRRFFMEIVNNEIVKSVRYKEPLTLAYFDIDDFKKINDQYGHTAGDRLLQLVANQATVTLRKSDVIARIGGDEFAILLPRTDYEASEVVLHRLKTMLVMSMQQEGLSVTVSIGAITFYHPPQSVNEILEQADNLMYMAKKKGKNLLQHELSKHPAI
ncbi:GGDEF domain-containing protein [Nostoc sp. CENA543]|uniref:GGDEF domain-containing protein n=1 Tax=Nostoc sp. CENA543 TaxID=1869241 RepID=UPI000CA3E381|nr:GGDEF domain-containing protein [Nostoc sp. CENA543]AUT01828.1 GGDEF domain-containing protein [Nostoc sp. CENA543]